MREGHRYPCGWCGETGHSEAACRFAPALLEEGRVEHRSGNGIYTGPCPVRVLPRGVGRDDLVASGAAEPSALELGRLRGRLARWGEARRREMQTDGTVKCARCGETGHRARTCFRTIKRQPGR